MTKPKRAHIDFKSIRFLSAVALMLLGIVIIAFLWLTQVTFLQGYIRRTKEDEFAGIARSMWFSVVDEETYDKVALENACNIASYRLVDGVYICTYSSTRQTTPALLDPTIGFEEDKTNQEFIYCYRAETAPDTLIRISQSSRLIDSTRQILRLQMIIATVIILVLSGGVSLLLSTALSADLRALAQSAKKLVTDDYNVHFDEKGFSESRAIAVALNYATSEMQKTENLRKELIANVSHDLRTPLTIIRGYAEMIRDLTGDNADMRNEQLSVIIKESDRLSGLVNDLLDLSRVQGEDTLSLSTIDLGALVSSSVGSFDLLAQRDGYTIHKDIQRVLVQADSKSLPLAVYNLVSNAINYTGEDKTISISVTAQDGEAVFRVKDSGAGLTEEQIQHIWQRYYRASSHKRSVVGTGLGLNIVHSVLTRHNARFGVESEVGHGSTFWFALPISSDAAE